MPPGNAGELAGWAALVLIFCLSLILLGSALAGITRMEPAKITGGYRVRFRGRQRWSYLGSRSVRIPSLWDSCRITSYNVCYTKLLRDPAEKIW